MRAERPINLLLASAPLLRLADVAKRAPDFEAAWRLALAGDGATPLQVPAEAAKRLLKITLGLCEATGTSGLDLTDIYNDRRDAAEFATPADLDQLLAAAAEELLAIMAGQNNQEQVA